ncbi:CD209 antigen-like [Xyrichtys novacula]|uniref:CD209 antigen-like n=1 Tax=Xyrichtys novacula TaxID=13765 RepID=A0AAV1ETP5_XYRNO|nr:CD209 antigen-like [Xyrichtys novacula]
MAVEYHASTLTNLETDDSKIQYEKLTADGNTFKFPVHALRNSPFRVATLFLSLLCLLLLLGVIGQSVHYQKVQQDNQNKLTALNKNKEDLQERLNTEQKEGKDIATNCEQLMNTGSQLNRKRDMLYTNRYTLTEQLRDLRLSEGQLQASQDTLEKEKAQLKASTDQLQSVNNTLTKERDLQQQQYVADLQQKNDLYASYDSVTKERDNLQNKFNNASRSKDELQKKYMKLVKDLEKLQERHNFSSYEKEKLEGSQKNLVNEILQLKSKLDALTIREKALHQNFSTAMSPSREPACDLQSEEREKEKVQKINDDLTDERDMLQGEVQRLNATINGKTCQTGWRKFQYSCYFLSTVKKNWNAARESCQIMGAELAIITRREEMRFVNNWVTKNQEPWIGLSDRGVEGQWEWVDGTPLTTTFWGTGQPNGHTGTNQDCVEFWRKALQMGEWNDEKCSIVQTFLCEI